MTFLQPSLVPAVNCEIRLSRHRRYLVPAPDALAPPDQSYAVPSGKGLFRGEGGPSPPGTDRVAPEHALVPGDVTYFD